MVEWLGPQGLSKTIWVVAEDPGQPVRVTGQRLDGAGAATFTDYEDNPNPTTELLLVDPFGLQFDHRGYVVYPFPGCWHFVAETGKSTVEMTLYVYERTPG